MGSTKKIKSVHLKLYHDHLNAGDQFSLVLARHYFSENVVQCGKKALTVPNLILVGSYLIAADEFSHVCGTGFISKDPTLSKLSAIPKAIHCVRGPLTAELLRERGVRCPNIYADPGILAPKLYPKKDSSCCKIGIVPHYMDANLPWIEMCRNKGISIINVLSPLDRYFSDMHSCEIILSSSLHGIIFAHAYGIPALWIELSDNVIGNGFKFYDYYLSLGVEPETVKRIRITEDTDPYMIAKLATIGDQSKLIAPLEKALSDASQQLRRDQILKSIWNILMPINDHNRKIMRMKAKRLKYWWNRLLRRDN